MVRFPCPKCGRRLKAPRAKAGSKATCTTCGEKMLVPGTAGGTPSNGAAGNDTPAAVFAFAATPEHSHGEGGESFAFTTAVPAASTATVAPGPVESFADLWLTPEPPSGPHPENADESPPLRWSVAVIAGACGLLLVIGLVLFLIGVIGGDDDPNPRDERSSLVGGRF